MLHGDLCYFNPYLYSDQYITYIIQEPNMFIFSSITLFNICKSIIISIKNYHHEVSLMTLLDVLCQKPNSRQGAPSIPARCPINYAYNKTASSFFILSVSNLQHCRIPCMIQCLFSRFFWQLFRPFQYLTILMTQLDVATM